MATLSLSLPEFLTEGSTPYHVTAALERLLCEHGFSRLNEDQAWQLDAGGRYFVVRGSSSLIAFMIPEVKAPVPFQIAAAHNDSPCFRVTGELHDGHYVRLTVEKYGGLLATTWFDRPLRLAGRVFLRTDRGARQTLFKSDARLVIPSVAIHQNREANERVMANPAVDLLPLFGKDEGGDALRAHIAETLGVSADAILSEDIYLVSAEEPFVWGSDYITAPRLDDLQCVYGLLDGFLNASPKRAIPMLAVLDGEEVGSATVQGADSTFLSDTVTRVACALGCEERETGALLASSFLISADNAHAVHPAHPELSDKKNAPYPGEGIVIKENAARCYTSDAFSVGLMRLLCEAANVPTQCFRARADMRCGSTLGNIANTHLSVPTVDIGLAQLAMHSACESAALGDTVYLSRMATVYFSSVRVEEQGEMLWQN